MSSRSSEWGQALVKAFGITVAVLAGLVILVALTLVVVGRETMLEMVFGPIDQSAVDFATIDTTGRENTYLVCPPGLCGQDPDRASPEFAIPATELRNRWFSMIGNEPLTDWIASDEEIQQYDFLQRTPLMRYPDTITVRFLSLDEERSTLAVYSRSHYGRKDFGVNRERIDGWLEALGG